MVISFGTVTHERTLGRRLHRRVVCGEVSEIDSSRSINSVSASHFFFFVQHTMC